MFGTVFISSTYADQVGLRQRLAYRLHAEGHRVFIAEPTSSAAGFIDLEGQSSRDVIEVSDSCLKALAQADAVVCILAGSLGSPIRLRDTLFRARHFEMEVFSAVVQSKPIFVCALQNFQPDPETRGFLECVLQGKVNYAQFPNEQELLDGAIAFCAGHERRRRQPLAGRIAGSLSIDRASFGTVRSHRMLLPFLGQMPLVDWQPNVDAAQLALTQAKTERDLHLKLSRLWIAMRELLPAVPQTSKDTQINALWDDILAAWVSASSWHGLHGHVYLGPVAAATGLWHLRVARSGERARDTEMPVGTVASANYSLIQRLPSPVVRHLAYRSLRRFLDRHMHHCGPKVLLIRGSISLRLWNPHAAIADFREVLRALEATDASPLEVADAKIHLAVPLAFIGQRRQARWLINEGLGEMRGKSDPGPMLRALRKATQIEKVPFGDPERVRQFELEARLVGKSEGYLDQSRHFRAD